MAIQLTAGNFDSTIAEGVTLVDFWAEWCGPCKMLLPIIEKVSSELEGRAKVAKVNVDEESEIASKFGIMSIPTIIVFKNGEAKEKMVGLRQKDALVQMVEKYL